MPGWALHRGLFWKPCAQPLTSTWRQVAISISGSATYVEARGHQHFRLCHPYEGTWLSAFPALLPAAPTFTPGAASCDKHSPPSAQSQSPLSMFHLGSLLSAGEGLTSASLQKLSLVCINQVPSQHLGDHLTYDPQSSLFFSHPICLSVSHPETFRLHQKLSGLTVLPCLSSGRLDHLVPSGPRNLAAFLASPGTLNPTGGPFWLLASGLWPGSPHCRTVSFTAVYPFQCPLFAVPLLCPALLTVPPVLPL